MRIIQILSAALLAFPMACSSEDTSEVKHPGILTADPPAMRWDHRPERHSWSNSAMLGVLRGPLPDVIPNDIADWCPAYASNAPEVRAAFWVGLLSAIAKHESTWNPQAVGGGGQWFGLMQISPATARGYGCKATTGEALKNGTANLSCAIRIIGQTVPRDGVVAAGGRGVAADWGPFRNAGKRTDMAAWTSSQSYCR